MEEAWAREEFERLLALATEALRFDPANPQILYRKAVAELATERTDEFRQTSEEALKLEPANPRLLLLKAIGRNAAGDYREARQAAEAVIDLDQRQSLAWRALAESLLASDEPAEGLFAAETAVGLNTTEDPLPNLKVLIRALGMNGEYLRANEVADQCLAAHPEDIQILSMKAAGLVQLDHNQEALRFAEQGYQLDPNHPGVLRTLAAALVLTQDYERAAEIQGRWASLEPEEPFAWTGLGAIYIMLERWEEAAMVLRRAIETSPEDVTPRVWLSGALLELDEADEALRMMTELSRANSEVEAVWLSRSSAERILGLDDDAVTSARRALEVGGFGSAEGWLELARCYSGAGRHPNAWRAFKKALQLDKSSREAALGIAVESILCSEESRAIGELREAEERFGASDLFEFNKGVALYKLGRDGEAREAWSRAHDLNPELGAAEVLAASAKEGVEPGSWEDYWFGAAAGWGQRIAGGALVLCLLVFLALPLIEKELIAGVETGDRSLEAFIPALLIALLLALPAIRRFAVGSVSMDVTPIGSPDQAPMIDPPQVLPVFAASELNVTRLTRR